MDINRIENLNINIPSWQGSLFVSKTCRPFCKAIQ